MFINNYYGTFKFLKNGLIYFFFQNQKSNIYGLIYKLKKIIMLLIIIYIYIYIYIYISKYK